MIKSDHFWLWMPINTHWFRGHPGDFFLHYWQQSMLLLRFCDLTAVRYLGNVSFTKSVWFSIEPASLPSANGFLLNLEELYLTVTVDGRTKSGRDKWYSAEKP